MAMPSTSTSGPTYRPDSKISVKVKVLVEPILKENGDSAIGTVIDSVSASAKTIFLPVDHLSKLREKKFYLLKNITMPGESLRVHKTSKIMQCGKFTFPPQVEEEFFNPPVVSVTEAIISPRKRRVSIAGELTNVSPVLESGTSRRKVLKLSSDEGTIEVKLWGKQANLPTPDIGNTVKVSCVTISEFRGRVDANSTEITQINEIADEVTFEGEVEAVTFDVDDAGLLLQGEDNIWSADPQTLQLVFPLEEFEDNIWVKGVRKGTKILKLERID